MRYTLTALLAVLLSTAALADSLHVTGVREWSPTDPPRVSRAFRTYVIVGTMNGSRYTAQQLFSWGSQRFTVGRDYEVTKADATSLTVIVPDKKGRKNTERLDVTSIEEDAK